jgi:hypothetical protein
MYYTIDMNFYKVITVPVMIMVYITAVYQDLLLLIITPILVASYLLCIWNAFDFVGQKNRAELKKTRELKVSLSQLYAVYVQLCNHAGTDVAGTVKDEYLSTYDLNNIETVQKLTQHFKQQLNDLNK